MKWDEQKCRQWVERLVGGKTRVNGIPVLIEHPSSKDIRHRLDIYEALMPQMFVVLEVQHL